MPTGLKHNYNSSSRCHALDGMRALAVLSVMGVHAGLPGLDAGWLGVDLFFVLSGFLITTLLCKEQAKYGRIDLKIFYLKRFLRLMPAYWLYVGGITIAIMLGVGHVSSHGGWTPSEYILSMWLYFNNYPPKGGIWNHQWLTLHLWSLSVEEQFYLLWPLLLILFGRSKQIAKLVTGLLIIQIVYVVFFASKSSVAGHLDGRGVSITIGCFFALMNEKAKLTWLRGKKPAAYSLIIVMLGFCLCTAAIMSGIHENTIKRYALIPFAFAIGALAMNTWNDALPAWAQRPLSVSWIVYLGEISYGIYLYHMLAHMAIWAIPIRPEGFGQQALVYFARLISYTLLTILIAAVSYRFYEQPFLRLKKVISKKDRPQTTRPSVKGAAGADA